MKNKVKNPPVVTLSAHKNVVTGESADSYTDAMIENNKGDRWVGNYYGRPDTFTTEEVLTDWENDTNHGKKHSKNWKKNP